MLHYLEVLNVHRSPLAMFKVYVEGDLHPNNCYLDKNKSVSLKSIELDFPYESWKVSNFYTVFDGCPDKCTKVEHEEMLNH